jgi:hypothetical protein
VTAEDARIGLAEWILAPLLVVLGWALKTIRARDVGRITQLRKWKHKHVIPHQQWNLHMIEMLCERTGVEMIPPPRHADDETDDDLENEDVR